MINIKLKIRNSTAKRISLILIIFALGLNWINQLSNDFKASNNPPETITLPTTKGDFALVKQVYDGDTFVSYINGQRATIRLIGIDTPETKDPRREVGCFGQQASDYATSILLNKYVRLEADPDQDNQDKYQRYLRYVYLEDGTLVNQDLIEKGYAYEYTYDSPYKFQQEFKMAEQRAEQSDAGLWSPYTCNGEK